MATSPRAARLAARAVALAVLAAFAALPAAAIARPLPAADDVAPALRLDIASYGPALVTPGAGFVVSASVANDGLEVVTNASITIAVSAEPLRERTQLDQWELGESEPDMREVARRSLGESGGIGALTQTDVTLVATPDALGFGAETWAVYAVSISLERDGVVVRSARTYVTYLAGDAPPTTLAIAATVSGGPARVDAILTAAQDPRIAILADPTALAAASVAAGDERTVYLLPAGNVDVASLARASDAALLGRALAAAREAPVPAAASPWIAAVPSIDASVLATAIGDGAAAVLVQQPLGSPGLDGADVTPATATPSGGAENAPPILVADPSLSAAIAGSRTPPALRAARALAVSAELAMHNTSGMTVLVAPGTSWVIEDATRSAALDAVLAAPWIEITSLPGLLASAPTATIDVPDNASLDTDIDSTVIGRASGALRDLEYLADASSDPAAVYAPPAQALFASLASEGRADPEARSGAIESAIEAVHGVVNSVGLAEGSTLNLISTSGNVPVTVRNDLDVDVTVSVVFQTRSPNLVVRSAPIVVIPAHSTAPALIPVTAVSSANVRAQVWLNSPDGFRLSPSTPVTVRVRADWGVAFTAVVGAAAILLLAGGIWRTVRRGRGATRATPGEAPPEEPFRD